LMSRMTLWQSFANSAIAGIAMMVWLVDVMFARCLGNVDKLDLQWSGLEQGNSSTKHCIQSSSLENGNPRCWSPVLLWFLRCLPAVGMKITSCWLSVFFVKLVILVYSLNS
jgi:hypothetical protein